MFSIAVIGTGQVGSRHVQGICTLAEPCALYMIDSQQRSLDLARERLNELPGKNHTHDVFAYQQLTNLPDQLDLVIIATSSSDRLQVLQELLAHCQVRNLVLEKFLFQRERDYYTAASLIARHGANAWVNCPRRLYELYRVTGEFFKGHQIQYLEVHGGDWGLACNGVHFADLFNYLTGSFVTKYETFELDDTISPGKRDGYIEFRGCLTGRVGKKRLQMTSLGGLNSRLLVLIRSESRSCMIDETAGYTWFLDEVEGWRNRQFTLPRQSELSGDLALKIIQHNHCSLPDYETAVTVHLPLLRSFLRHYAEISDPGATSCPIT